MRLNANKFCLIFERNLTPNALIRSSVLVLAAALLTAMVGCGQPSKQIEKPIPINIKAQNGFPVTLQDSRGKTVTIKSEPKRIVSLAPSNTELLYALGIGDRVAADTTACDFPEEAKSKPHVSGAAGQIDLEKVEAANPDLVIAVGSINQKAIESIEKAGITVVSLEPKTVADVAGSVRLLGKATGKTTQAEKIIADLNAHLDTVRKLAYAVSSPPKVLIAYSDRPIYTTGLGSFIDDLITIAGGRNIVDSKLLGSIISPEKVVALQPDVIICDPGEAAKLSLIPGWKTGVPAVRNHRFFSVSEGATLVRPSPRLAAAAEELIRFLHPELFVNKGTK